MRACCQDESLIYRTMTDEELHRAVCMGYTCPCLEGPMKGKKASFLADEAWELRQRLEREICGCGHQRIIHGAAVRGLAAGHGKCFANHCPCAKFTWHHEDESRITRR